MTTFWMVAEAFGWVVLGGMVGLMTALFAIEAWDRLFPKPQPEESLFDLWNRAAGVKEDE